METKTQIYLRKKKALEDGLPLFWVIKSSPEGVEKPRSCQSLEKIELSTKYRYLLETDKFPYELDINKGDISITEKGYGTGCGDLWGWTYYSTISKEDADEYYEKELIRVTEKYLNL